MAILAKFAEGGHIDPELYRIFVETGVYLDYEKAFMDRGQVDGVAPQG